MFMSLFNVDALSLIMVCLVGFVSLTVASFATRYMKGDTHYKTFFIQLLLIVSSVTVMVCADNLWLLLAAFGISNLLLVRLMIHKAGWKAAKASGLLAAKTYLFGFACITIAFMLFYDATGQSSIWAIINAHSNRDAVSIGLCFLLVGAMTQSAIYPFHKWLISSLNSPSPVSAIMHAGLVNGGGFLLARFAPLYVNTPRLLGVIFLAGLATALLGTLWKLMQHDVKRMLACSTMAQMGFMVAQCGLGLFPAAVAHLCWHGLFKAYLFLASGGAAQEKRLDPGYPPRFSHFLLALTGGIAGAFGFCLASGKTGFAADTHLVLIAIAFIAGTQFALTLLRQKDMIWLPLILIVTFIIGNIYGLNVLLVEQLLAPLHLMQPQPLNLLHIVAISALASVWLGILFFRHHKPEWLHRFYVLALNASQPHTNTITAYRNHYRYV